MSIGQRIADEAATWVGTPHAYFERAKGEGVDCLNLLAGSLVNAGLLDEEESWGFFDRLSDAESLESADYDVVTWEIKYALDAGLLEDRSYRLLDPETNHIQVGDIVTIHTDRSGRPKHAAISVSSGYQPRVVHALETETGGRVARTPLPKDWQIADIYRIHD